MFPAKLPGAALLIFRVAVAGTLLAAWNVYGPLAPPLWALAGPAILMTFLCLGYLTPYCAILNCVIEVGISFAAPGEGKTFLGIAVVNSVVLAALGPGAYSIDARIFGRRTLTVPSRR